MCESKAKLVCVQSCKHAELVFTHWQVLFHKLWLLWYKLCKFTFMININDK